MRDYNDKIVASAREQGVLLTQISSYIKHAPLRRLK